MSCHIDNMTIFFVRERTHSLTDHLDQQFMWLSSLSEEDTVDIRDFRIFNEDSAVDKNRKFMISKSLDERMTLGGYNLEWSLEGVTLGFRGYESSVNAIVSEYVRHVLNMLQITTKYKSTLSLG